MNDKIDGLYQEAKFLLKGHILNPFWRERNKRRWIRCYYSHQKIDHYLQKYKSFVENLQLEDLPELQIRDTSQNKIFSIWFQGEEQAPKLVKVCFDRLRHAYPDRYIVLDNETLWERIELPDQIMQKWKDGKIIPANFSDICRVALLYKYGGMWFDATDFLTAKVPQWIEDSDLFILTTGDRITPHKLIQSCFMHARARHPLFGALLEFIYEYWSREEKSIDYFLLHFMLRFIVENNKKAHDLFYKMPLITHEANHNLWYKYIDAPFSEELYREATKDTFFQKTTFKSKEAKNPIPGSMADYIVNGKIKLVEP